MPQLDWQCGQSQRALVSILALILVTENTPPIITVHGDVDTVVPYEQASTLHESLSTTNH